MVNKLLSYSMASVTVKTTNSPNRQSATTVYWHEKVLMVQNLIIINNGLYFLGIAVQTGNF